MKTALLSILILVACVLFPAQDAAAQKSGLHPGVDTIGTVTRAPWFNAMVSYQKTHTSIYATADTFLIKGLKSTDFVMYNPRTIIDSLGGAAYTQYAKALNIPTITLLSADTLIFKFRRPDTLTYDFLAIRKQF